MSQPSNAELARVSFAGKMSPTHVATRVLADCISVAASPAEHAGRVAARDMQLLIARRAAGPRDKRPGVGSRRGGTARLGAPRDGQDRAGRGRGKGAATAKAARPASSEVARKWAAPAIQPLAVLLDDDDDGGPTPLPLCLCLSWAREERFARLLRRLAVGVSGVGGGEWTTLVLSK